MITLRSPSMSVEIDDEHGATIIAVRDAAARNALAHEDWEAPQPAHRGLSYGNDDLDFHSSFRGGWQETFPNAGQSCVVDGVPLPFHGEASSARWTVRELEPQRVVMSVPARLPLVLQRTMEVDAERAVLRIHGEVTNVGGVPADFVWGQHPAFPATPGARIDYPAGARIRPDVERSGDVSLTEHPWPHAATLDGGTRDLSELPGGPIHELYYVDALAEGWAAVRQPGDVPSVALAWDRHAHPYSWLWIMRGEPGFPFYGRGSMLAIEAQTAWPYDGLTNARRRGMAHRLLPGQSMTSWYTMALFDDHGVPVQGVDRGGRIEFGA